MRRRFLYEMGVTTTLAGASLLAWPLAKSVAPGSAPLTWIAPALFLLVWRGSLAVTDLAIRALLPGPAPRAPAAGRDDPQRAAPRDNVDEEHPPGGKRWRPRRKTSLTH